MCPNVQVGVDFYGNDIGVQYGLQPETCCRACGANANCKAFTFVNKNDNGQSACYLKSGGGMMRSNPGAISAYKI